MPEKVQKRDGRLEDFQVEKLKKSIEKASQSANLEDDKISEIVEQVTNFVLESIKDLERIDTESLRTLILGKLDELQPEVSEAWRKYDREIKGRN